MYRNESNSNPQENKKATPSIYERINVYLVINKISNI